MPWYKLTRKFDNGFKVYERGEIIEFPATDTHPKGLAPSTAVHLNADALAAEQQKKTDAEEAAFRHEREKMKQEILAEIRNEATKEEAAETVAEMSKAQAVDPGAKQAAKPQKAPAT